MTNKNLLRAAIIAKGYNNETFASELGISRQSLSFKINNKRPFRSNEISIASHILGLTPAQVMQIFFANYDDEKGTNEVKE